MEYLYKTVESIRSAGYSKNMPRYISDDLNPAFELRPYQIDAFKNFITYFESSELRTYPSQTLFHMATGSGKTLIMAGLIIYLYKMGYRNFLFFVNSLNIVRKTKDNFLNRASGKYLFAPEIVIDGERVQINEVSNFQFASENAVNICFTTTQSLHTDMWITKENSLSADDFENHKVVLISDEAHHLNADTLQGNISRMSAEEKESYHSWESTVRNIVNANKDNVLLEFTATCDTENPLLSAQYANKIIFDYPLYKFSADRYSKEIKTLRSDIPLMDRELQAVILSQYRLKVFQDNKILMKPIVLFKASKIAESKQQMIKFSQMIGRLTGSDIARISCASNSDIMNEAFSYFENKGITFDELAQELKEDFGEEHIISANDDKEAEEKQLLLNTLEDNDNPYRAVFEVKKLDEGWDVLNLFDIVRLYETRDARSGRPGKTTVSEAQLIGRGARYCPFAVTPEQPKFQRKFDDNVGDPLRVCEELYYHCQNSSRYIDELKTALRETGIDLDKAVTVNYTLKPKFKEDDFYKNGLVFTNSRNIMERGKIKEIPLSLRNKVYTYSAGTGAADSDTIFGENRGRSDSAVETHMYSAAIADIADHNYSIVYKALCRFNVFKFSTLKKYFPDLRSTREFIFDKKYLGAIIIEITSPYSIPTPSIFFNACISVLSKIAENISWVNETYDVSKDFQAYYIHDIFTDKKCTYTAFHDGGMGVSQNDSSLPAGLRLDLSAEDWFVYEDDFGTSEEKAFIAYFKKYAEKLKQVYDKVYLIRNQRQLHIYSFDNGERFEPDYLLFLLKATDNGYEQLQVFIEPKGTHLLTLDAWKEKFLLDIERYSVPVVKGSDDNTYKISGLHFFNQSRRTVEFKCDMDSLVEYGKTLNSK